MSSTGPNPKVRHLAALMFRSGLGMIVLETGLVGRLAAQGGLIAGVVPASPRMPMGPGSELFSDYLPYIQIGVGLALILGFLTTVAAVMAWLLSAGVTLFQMIMLSLAPAGSLPGGFAGQWPLFSMNLALSFLLCGVVVWVSSVASNPWSLDGLIFGRSGPILPAPEPPPPDPVLQPVPAPVPVPEPAAPAPGERVARFLSQRDPP